MVLSTAVCPGLRVAAKVCLHGAPSQCQAVPREGWLGCGFWVSVLFCFKIWPCRQTSLEINLTEPRRWFILRWVRFSYSMKSIKTYILVKQAQKGTFVSQKNLFLD